MALQYGVLDDTKYMNLLTDYSQKTGNMLWALQITDQAGRQNIDYHVMIYLNQCHSM